MMMMMMMVEVLNKGVEFDTDKTLMMMMLMMMMSIMMTADMIKKTVAMLSLAIITVVRS